MAKLVTKGNIALFEYPAGADKPSFTLDKDGVLLVEGYSLPFFPNGKPIRSMMRFPLGLVGYTLVGEYDKAKNFIEGDFSDVASSGEIDTTRCIVLIKNNDN